MFFVAACVALYKLVRIVPTNTILVLERLGQITRVLTPGIRVLYPGENVRSISWSFNGSKPETRPSLPQSLLIDPRAWILECSDGSIELDVVISVHLTEIGLATRSTDPLRMIALRVLNSLAHVVSKRTCSDCLRNKEALLQEAEQNPVPLRDAIGALGFRLEHVTIESLNYTATTKQLAEQRVQHQFEISKMDAELQHETRRIAALRELGVDVSKHIETMNLARAFLQHADVRPVVTTKV